MEIVILYLMSILIAYEIAAKLMQGAKFKVGGTFWSSCLPCS